MSCGCLKTLKGLMSRGKGKAGKQPQQPAKPGAPVSDPTKTAPAQGAPSNGSATQPGAAPSTPATIEVDVVNQTDGSQPVYVFITGQAINNNSAVFLLQSDGKTPYYPANPSATNADLTVNCAIQLGGAGAATTCTIPQIAGGRIWFSLGQPIKFLLNPGQTGPALVEPSVNNPSDPSINITWDFAEFTYNAQQLFANISYVDFACLPVSLDLYDTSGSVQHVAGMPSDGLTTIVNGINAQQAADNAGWDKLIVNGANGAPLRVLSPNSALTGNTGLFSGYWEPYIDQVWNQLSTTPLQIDTQASFGTVSGTVQNGTLTFSGGATFAKPTGQDVFSCSSGPFSGTTQEELAITPRLAAAFNRSTLQLGKVEPDGLTPNEYYQSSPTNHYSRIVHAANLDNRGYAFPYDDVVPTGGSDVAGTVFTGTPQKLVVTVGGANAHN